MLIFASPHHCLSLDTDSTAEASAGLEEFMNQHANGGAIFSVHQPTKALTWLEQNYDLPLLRDMRGNSISGPLPMMLFPTVSALTIFGPHRDDKMFRFARRLANKSTGDHAVGHR
jgi:hypothetical protein